jgi:hypothetical protein
MDEDINDTITLSAGNVEYSLENARVEIDELIELLESAKSEGAIYVVGTSGNYRGAKWTRLGTMYGWSDDDE